MLWKILWEGFIQREPVRELERCGQEVQVLHPGMASLNSSVSLWGAQAGTLGCCSALFRWEMPDKESGGTEVPVML